MNVLVLDSQCFVRRAIRNICSRKINCKVKEAACGAEAIRILNEFEIDLIVLDIQLPGENGISLLSTIRQISQKLIVIVLTELDEKLLSPYITMYDVEAFLSKRDSDSGLVIDLIEMCLVKPSENSARRSPAPKIDGDGCDAARISRREQQVLQLISLGKTNKEIARGLGLEVYTVESYRKSLMSKTKCRNTAELVTYAIRTGIYNL